MNAINIKINPIFICIDLVLTVLKNINKSSRCVKPLTPYINENPSINKMEENDPIIKYFIPDSSDFFIFLLYDAKI